MIPLLMGPAASKPYQISQPAQGPRPDFRFRRFQTCPESDIPDLKSIPVHPGCPGQLFVSGLSVTLSPAPAFPLQVRSLSLWMVDTDQYDSNFPFAFEQFNNN